jgi:hypothetical protein
MIAEAIEKLQQLTSAAAKTTVFPVDVEPKGTYYLVGPDGKAELKVAAPGWHGEKLATPQQLADFVADRKTENSVVFYNETGIHFVYDRDDRRDGAYCKLLISPQYSYLSSACSAMKQSDFIRLLRIQFRGCLGESNLLPLAKNLKFTNDQAAAGQYEQGRQSLSRGVVAQVTGADAFPEEVTLTVPVFENFEMRTTIDCALEVMPMEQQFKLTPFPLELSAAMNETLVAIAGLFTGKDMPPIYKGAV